MDDKYRAEETPPPLQIDISVYKNTPEFKRVVKSVVAPPQNTSLYVAHENDRQA